MSAALRLLRMEWRREHAAAGNVLAGRDALSRAAAARGLATAALLGGGVAWIAARLATAPAGGPAPADALRGALASAGILGLLLFVDGVRRGAGLLANPAERRLEEEWLPAAGVPPLAIGARGAARGVIAAACVCWVPLLALVPAAPRVTAGLAFAGCAVGLAHALAGGAAGRAWRHGGRGARVLVSVAVCLWGALLLARLFDGPAAPAVVRAAAGAAWVAAPWRAALGAGAAWAGLLAAVAAGGLDLWARVASARRAGWGERRRAVARAASGAGRAPDAPRGRLQTLARADLQRLAGWARRDALVALVILCPTVAMYAALAYAPPALRALVASPSVLPWAVLYALAWPALACCEAAWGADPPAAWAWYRVALVRLDAPLLARVAVLAAVLGAWHLALTLLFVVAAGPGPALVHALLGALVIAGAVPLHALCAAAAVRGGFGGGVSARLLRYAGLSAGALLPPAVHAATGSPAAAILAAAAGAAAGCGGALGLLARAQFSSDGHT